MMNDVRLSARQQGRRIERNAPEHAPPTTSIDAATLCVPPREQEAQRVVCEAV